MNHTVVLFDLDGTLIDSRPSAVAATQAAFEFHGYRIPEIATIHSWMGVPIERSFPLMLPDDISKESLDVLIETFRKEYRRNSHLTELVPGIRSLLGRLNSHSRRCAVVTSKKSSVAMHDLSRLEIADYVEFVVGSDSVGEFKPHPEPALHALRRMGSSTGIVVGDSTFDVTMGKAAGTSTCAVTWGVHTAQELLDTSPDYIVHTVPELENILISDDIRTSPLLKAIE